MHFVNVWVIIYLIKQAMYPTYMYNIILINY